jgi:hypothetical protein
MRARYVRAAKHVYVCTRTASSHSFKMYVQEHLAANPYICMVDTNALQPILKYVCAHNSSKPFLLAHEMADGLKCC